LSWPPGHDNPARSSQAAVSPAPVLLPVEQPARLRRRVDRSLAPHLCTWRSERRNLSLSNSETDTKHGAQKLCVSRKFGVAAYVGVCKSRTGIVRVERLWRSLELGLPQVDGFGEVID